MTAWAALGVICLVAQAWVLGRWLFDGGLLTLSWNAAEDVSTVRRWVFVAGQCAIVAGVGGCAVWIVRDALRRGEVTVHAALFLGYGTAHWLDPVLNWDRGGFANNHATVHVAGWGPYLPGWHGPDTLPQPLLYATGLFFPLLILWIWAGAGMVRWLRRRRPRWGRARLALALLAPVAVMDAVAESLLIRTGAYSYAGAAPELSLFGGHWYQFPIAEMVLSAALFVIPTVLLTGIADTSHRGGGLFQGDTFRRPGLRVAVRLLSGIGYAHLSLLLWLTSVSLFLTHPTAPLDTPSFLRGH
ncbi:spirocyclase AveC family protein [Streptomyces sp. NPDC058653]|uniref:spirocyclase AveC family protein n=1 Tax=Streptomyces sp. NPDC058653 TaxID=3346576 RepID=UPI003656527F